MPKDFYVVLGIGRGADLNKIKKAYRVTAKKYHPDLCSSRESVEKFHEATEAYETLGDEEKRRRYDQELFGRRSSPGITRAPETILRSRSPFEDPEQRAGFVDDFFSGLVPGFFGRERHKDLYLEMVLSPREAERGGLFNLTVPVFAPCPRCAGSGRWESFFCSLCFGRGKIQEERQFSLSVPPRIREGTRIRVSMEEIGLRGVDIYILVTVEPFLEEDA